MTKPQKILLMAVTVLCVGVIASLLIIGRTLNECETLKEVPLVPTYPQSAILRTWEANQTNNDYSLILALLGGKDQANTLTTHYETEASIEELKSFYKDELACIEIEFGNQPRDYSCIGEVNPSGEYTVIISPTQNLNGKTEFILEIRWWSCSKYL